MRKQPAKYKSPPSRADATRVLNAVWGHTEFRRGQWDIVEAVLSGRDVLAVLPTGTGKSVCYQLPALMRPGLTVVVSPLVALMRDQVDSLVHRGVGATLIDSSLSYHEADQRLTDCRYGRHRLLYVSPERLRSAAFAARCRDLDISTVAVDEAHCISEWGHSFRPAYLDIADWLSEVGRPPVVALTATATPRVRDDIEKALGLADPVRVTGGFDRPNIVWSVYRNQNKRHRVEAVLRGVEGSGIIYTSTRRDSEAWAAWLQQIGVEADAYHAGLSRASRDGRQKRWMSGASRVIVATSAFGMGIDKPDVRFVVHVSLSASLESYYQEAGRAGRDGKRSYAVLLYNDGDQSVQEALVRRSFPGTDLCNGVYETVCSMAGVPVGGGAGTPVMVDVDLVARSLSSDSGIVRGAIEYLDREGVVSIADNHSIDGYLRLWDVSALGHLVELHPDTAAAKLGRQLLRSETLLAAGERWTGILVDQIARHAGMEDEAVPQALQYLEAVNVVEWKPSTDGLQIVLNGDRPARLRLDGRHLKRGRRAAVARLRELIAYINSRTCRRERILAYFGDSSPPRCGRCDICMSASSPVLSVEDRRRVISDLLEKVRAGIPRNQWGFGTGVDQGAVDECLDLLIREGRVRVSPRMNGTFEIAEPDGKQS